MFLRLFTRKLTLCFFLTGYIVTFVISIIQRESIFRTAWISFIGGIVCIGIWIVLIKIIIFLLSEEEISAIFKISSEENKKKEYQSDETDDDSELTAEELYGILKQEENSSDTNLFLNIPVNNIYSENQDFKTAQAVDTPSKTSNFSKKEYEMESDGKFDFTIGGKTLHADPKDGAQAIRKVLIDDKKEEK